MEYVLIKYVNRETILKCMKNFSKSVQKKNKIIHKNSIVI